MSKPDLIQKIRYALLACALCACAGLNLRAQTVSTGPSLDEILAQLSTLDGGIDSAPFWKLRDYVYARKDDAAARAACEIRLLQFLGAKATPLAKMAACRMLRLIGSESAVPVLQPMLVDSATSDMALYALEKIPVAAADKALIQTLPKVDGETKTAIIAALGNRKSRDAVPVLASLLHKDGAFAGAAALSLSEIGGAAASDALSAAYAETRAELKPIVAASLMKAAEGLLTAKNERAAVLIYEKLLSDKALPPPLREAAMIGRISASGARAGSVLLDQLKSSLPEAQEAAILKIKEVIKPENIASVCKLLPGLAPSTQVKLLAVLSGYPKDRVLSTVLQAARSSEAEVRIAAFKALESVGDASTVPILAETAANTRGAEQNAARGALGLLKGRPVDDAVLALLVQKPPEEVQGELLLAIAERRIFAGKSVVAAALASPSARIRMQGMRALRSIGTPSDMPAVLDLLIKSSDDAERIEAESTTAALAQKIANPDGRSNAVRSRLASEKDVRARARLYRVISRTGDDSALPLLRTALMASEEEIVDAAVRALAAWPTAAARDDLVELARQSKNEIHRLLALQGFLRMINLERYRKPEAAVADLRQAYFLAARAEEKRLILSALARFACPEALDLAGWFLGEPAVKAEAQAAIDKLKSRLANR